MGIELFACMVVCISSVQQVFARSSKARSPCILGLVALFAVMSSSSMCHGQSLTLAEKTQIQTGVNVGKAMADTLVSKDFSKALTSVAKSIGPYLGTLGPLMGLVLAFIPMDSAVLSELKKMAEQIDNRFDQIDSSFDEVKNMIKWSQVAINFGDIEQTIIAMEEEYKLLYTASPKAALIQKHVFITKYLHNFDLSATKFYDAIVKPNGIFHENLGKAAMRYTKYNRRQTQSFLQGVLRLMTRAVQIEIAAWVAQGYDVKSIVSVWTNRTKQVVSKFKQIDSVLMDYHLSQSKLDTIDMAITNPGLSHSSFASSLNNFLKDKYYWRDWLVVVYDPLHGYQAHKIKQSGGFFLFREHGRNIVVASAPSAWGNGNLEGVRITLDYVPIKMPNGKYLRKQATAEYVYDHLKKSVVSVALGAGVIRTNSKVGYAHSGRKAFHYVKRGKFNIHVWG